MTGPGLATLVLLALPLPPAAEPPPPNLVLIVADDLGWGDLGCYGQRRVATPNLDRLAREGRRWTQFYAGSTVCAPSRCVLMTGRHVGRALVRGNGRQPLRPEDVTVAEVLREAGYATGLFGKWGLGLEGTTGTPRKQGFDEFYGYLSQMHAHNYWPSFLVRGEEREALPNVVPDEGAHGQGVATVREAYSHDLVTDAALDFVARHAERPFFLYLAWTIPHANNEAGRAGMEVPDLGPYADRDWPDPEKGFAGMLHRMDRDVGRLLDLLAERGIDDRTLVLFTSDNGPHAEGGHDPDFFDSNGPLRGLKRDLTDGGIRVPLVARWPGTVPAGTVSAHVAGFQDVLPTLAELGGADPGPADSDGISFAPSLRGEEAAQRAPEALYWEFYERGGARALRAGRWKVVQQPRGSAPRLYDLDADVGEARDLAADEPERLAELVRRMDAAREPSEHWRWKE